MFVFRSGHSSLSTGSGLVHLPGIGSGHAFKSRHPQNTVILLSKKQRKHGRLPRSQSLHDIQSRNARQRITRSQLMPQQSKDDSDLLLPIVEERLDVGHGQSMASRLDMERLGSEFSGGDSEASFQRVCYSHQSSRRSSVASFVLLGSSESAPPSPRRIEDVTERETGAALHEAKERPRGSSRKGHYAWINSWWQRRRESKMVESAQKRLVSLSSNSAAGGVASGERDSGDCVNMDFGGGDSGDEGTDGGDGDGGEVSVAAVAAAVGIDHVDDASDAEEHAVPEDNRASLSELFQQQDGYSRSASSHSSSQEKSDEGAKESESMRRRSESPKHDARALDLGSGKAAPVP